MMNRRYILLVLVIPAIVVCIGLSVKKDVITTRHNDAEIIGIDNSLRPCRTSDPCNCPGGFYIHIDNLPDPKGKCISCTSFKAIQFPDGFSLGDDPLFPVNITIDWDYASLNCDSSRINIISIVKK